MRIFVLILCVTLAGCVSWEQVEDAFDLPMDQYDAKWYPKLNWTIEDIHVYVNGEVDDMASDFEAEDMERYRNGTCLLSAERKYELALRFGFDEGQLEIVVVKLSEDAAIKADWSNGWPTHAVLRYYDTVYDNGFISDLPFNIKHLQTPRYGTIIPDQWSKYRKEQ